jgi:hypothetical protein
MASILAAFAIGRRGIVRRIRQMKKAPVRGAFFRPPHEAGNVSAADVNLSRKWWTPASSEDGAAYSAVDVMMVAPVWNDVNPGPSASTCSIPPVAAPFG